MVFLSRLSSFRRAPQTWSSMIVPLAKFNSFLSKFQSFVPIYTDVFFSPVRANDVTIEPSGLRKYFHDRRLGLECYCGLKEDKPQFVKIKSSKFGHYISCNVCGLYCKSNCNFLLFFISFTEFSVSLNSIRDTADFWAIYPSMDANGGRFST